MKDGSAVNSGINYSSASVTPQLSEWHAQVEKATMELVKKHLLATNDLTEEQLADAIGQALLSGDFQKLVVASTGAQCVTYIPFQREQALENRIGKLMEEITFLKPVVEAADQLESWLGKHSGDNRDWPINIRADNQTDADSLSLLLTHLHQALKPIRELREAGME